MRRESAALKCSSWQDSYQQKLSSAEDIAAMIKSGDIIAMGGGSCVPEAFADAMTARGKELSDLTLLVGFALKHYDFMKEEYRDNFHIETVFVGPMERTCIKKGLASYVPVHLQDLGRWLDNKRPNIVATMVSPPDENGYMNRSCFGGLLHRRAFEQADKVIVEVNSSAPYLCGDDYKIHVSEVDHIIENQYQLTEVQDIEISDKQKQIATIISDMIPNGSTIQLGLGGLANAVGYFLRDKKDLGLHAEVVSNSVMDLMKLGVVNGSKKNFMPGKVLGCYLVGNQELWDFVDHNEDFVFCEVEYINDPKIISSNDNLISINNTLMLDLTGQAASESIGTSQYSGTGGQVNFVKGATRSRGGKSILSLNSTFTDKEGKLQSRIVPTLPGGTIISTSRNDVEYIVTEFGAACLRWKSVADRVKELVNIAHPDFRDELLFQAKKEGWV